MRAALRWALLAAAVVLWLWLPALLPGRQTVLVLLALYVPAVVGVSLLAGYTGRVSLGQAAFFGMGAYGTAVLSVHLALSPWIAMPIAIVGSALAAWLIGAPVLMLRGQYVVLATLGFNVIFVVVTTQLGSVTGGASGFIGIRPLTIAGSALISNEFFYYAGSALAAVSVLVSARLVRSRTGRALQAIEGSEAAASTLGVDRRRETRQIFVWSAVLAAASGCLYSEWIRFISPGTFSIDLSIDLLIMAALGGITSIGGAVAGTAVFLTVRELLQALAPSLSGAQSGDSAPYELIAFGALLALTLIFVPEGLWPRLRRLATGRPTRRAEDEGHVAGPLEIDAGHTDSGGPLLRVEGLRQQFGGLRALDDVSVSVAPGTVLAVIGPNGAGKTTFLNIISGVLNPTAGSIEIDGRQVAGRAPHRIAQCGVARTFQTPRLFDLLDVGDNVTVGLHRHLRAGFLRSALGLNRREERTAREQAARALTLVGSAELTSKPVRSLSFGQLRLVELARCLISQPRLLLLDEPASGLTGIERAELRGLVQQIRQAGTTVVLVEHDVPLVMDVADHVVVLHHGAKIADGTPSAIASDERVINAYLGAATEVERPGQPVGDTATPLLKVSSLSAGYGPVRVLEGIDLEVRPGEVVGLLGANGAGKTTLTRALTGLLPARGDRVFDGRSLDGIGPEALVGRGFALVPEGRELFRSLTVDDHIRLGRHPSRGRGDTQLREDLERVHSLFPILAERRRQPARSLSGGEQQMLAIARALMSRPRLLVLDEPLLGLAPLVVTDILEVVIRLAADGVAVLLAEQNAATVFPLLDRAYVLEIGRIVSSGRPEQLQGLGDAQTAFLGAPARPAADGPVTHQLTAATINEGQRGEQ